MKNNARNTTLHSIAFAIIASSVALAADPVTTKTTTTKPDGSTETSIKTTTGSGTITEYVPGTTFIVKETSGPVTYRYGKTVTYVTKSGTTLTEEAMKTRIKVGLPVSVQYITDGDHRVINRVVIDD